MRNINQLDLLSYQLTAEELAEPEPVSVAVPPAPAWKVNQNAIDWYEAKVLHCLKLMNRFMRLGKPWCKYEILRLDELRQQALERLKELRGEAEVVEMPSIATPTQTTELYDDILF